MHVDRDAEHGVERKQVGADEAEAVGVVVGADLVHVLEGRHAVGRPVRLGPRRVGELRDEVRDVFRQLDGLAFDDGAGELVADHVVAVGRHGQAAGRAVVAGEAVAGEVGEGGGHVARGLHHGGDGLLLQLGVGAVLGDDLLNGRGAGEAADLVEVDAVLEGAGAGVALVDDAARADLLDVFAAGLLDAGGRPVRADVGEELGHAAGEGVGDDHADAVLGVVLGGDGHGGAVSVPVEHRVEQGLRHVEVRVAVGPLPLALGAGAGGVVALGPLDVALGERRIAAHQVLDHDGETAALAQQLVRRERALAFAVVELERRLHPLERLLDFGLVVEAGVDARIEAGHVERCRAHAEGLEELVAAQVGADDAHRNAADAEIVLAADPADGGGAAGEAQQALGDERVEGLVLILEVGAVDREDGALLLVHRGAERLEPHGAGAVGLVEAPRGLLPFGGAETLADGHEFVAVAPGAGDPDVGDDAFLGEGGLGDGAGAGAVDDLGRDDDAHGPAVGQADVFGDEVVDLLGHAPGLFGVVLERAGAAVRDGGDGDGRDGADEIRIEGGEGALGGGKLGEVGTR